MKNQNGYILIIILIFVFLLSLVIMHSSQDRILEYKMQNTISLDQAIFNRAEAGVNQIEMHLMHDDIHLPNSDIVLTTQIQFHKINVDGSKTYLIQSIASYQDKQVVLNVCDTFVTVPIIRLYRIAWKVN